MEKSISKKILLEFLKKNNLVGSAFAGAYAQPYLMNKRNIYYIIEGMEMADRMPTAENLKHILGYTFSPKKMDTQLYDTTIKKDIMFELYKKWAGYVTKNWLKIDEYYKD